jgi:hypothetical protein
MQNYKVTSVKFNVVRAYSKKERERKQTAIINTKQEICLIQLFEVSTEY